MRNKRRGLAMMLITLLVIVMSTGSVFAGVAPKLPANTDKYYDAMYYAANKWNFEEYFLDAWATKYVGDPNTVDVRDAAVLCKYIDGLANGVCLETIYNIACDASEPERDYEGMSILSYSVQDKYLVNGQYVYLTKYDNFPRHSLFRLTKDEYNVYMAQFPNYLNNEYTKDSQIDREGLFGMINAYNANVNRLIAYENMLAALKVNAPTTYNWAMNNWFNTPNSEYQLTREYVQALSRDIDYYIMTLNNEYPMISNYIHSNGYTTVYKSIQDRDPFYVKARSAAPTDVVGVVGLDVVNM